VIPVRSGLEGLTVVTGITFVTPAERLGATDDCGGPWVITVRSGLEPPTIVGVPG